MGCEERSWKSVRHMNAEDANAALRQAVMSTLLLCGVRRSHKVVREIHAFITAVSKELEEEDDNSKGREQWTKI